MLQALRDEYRLDLLSWKPVDLDAVNDYYGTDLRRGELHLVPFPRVARLLDLVPAPWWLLESAVLMRSARALADRYEALISADNEADFGRRAIQYVHYPRGLRPRPAADLRWYHVPALLRWYYGVVDRIAPFNGDRVRRNLTLVNSDWTGELLRRLYPGIHARTLYPPVAGRFPTVPWEEREDGVAVVGRISGEKRVDLAIEIVRRVRERGWRLRLHVIGTPDDRDAHRRVRTLARRHDWLVLHENLSRGELCVLLSRLRYGLHAMEDEHYGVAVAEMVVAGLIPFVPDSGGQREIVECVPDVRWKTPEEAIDRMCAVLDDPERRRRILQALAARRALLGTEHFIGRVREEVARFLAGDDPSLPSDATDRQGRLLSPPRARASTAGRAAAPAPRRAHRER